MVNATQNDGSRVLAGRTGPLLRKEILLLYPARTEPPTAFLH
jgi:hypothetical protein